jgi:multidrug efflux pump subunit AcrA (membrane-fusion protein)
LDSAENRDITCRVKAKGSSGSGVSTTIRWVIADGTPVKKGELVVQLDDSALEDSKTDQLIKVDNAYAAYIKAKTDYDIQVSQNISDIAAAQLVFELALDEMDKYNKGDYLAKEQELLGLQNNAQTDLAMWEERSAWSDRMSRAGRRFVTVAQAQADAAKLRSAQIALAKTTEDVRVLQKYTGPRTRKEIQGRIDEAKRAMDRVKIQADAKRITAEAAKKAAKSTWEQEKKKAEDLSDEIKKCKILAPQDGLVVYHVDERSKWGGGQQSLIAQGEPVREGQKLMRIPNLNKMVVATKIHEAMVSRVHAGLPAQVRVEAFSGKTMRGKVKAIATVASKQSWLSSDVQVYEAQVEIEGVVPGLKPDMTAEVTIFTDSQRDSALTIPVQAILGSVDMGNTRRIYVQTDNGPEARDVTIGLSNDRMAEVLTGLKEGDEVIVNPLVLLSAEEKAKFAPTPAGGAKGKDKGKDKGGKAPGKGGKGGKGGPPA